MIGCPTLISTRKVLETLRRRCACSGKRLPVPFGDQAFGQGDLRRGPSQRDRSGRIVSEYPLDFGRRANLGRDLLEALRASCVGQEEYPHNIVNRTGRAVFVRGRSPGRLIRGLVQLIHEPFAKYHLGSSSARAKSSGLARGEEPSNVPYQSDVGG